MRHTLLIIRCSLFIFSACSRPEPVPDIFLLIGQSNMAGRGIMTSSDTIPLRNVLLFNDSNRFEPARHPLNRYSTIRKDLSLQGIGLGYEFGRYLSDTTGRTIGLVVNARGGTGISEWQKGCLYYSEAVKRTKAAMKQGNLKAVIWHQGSADQRHPESYTGQIRKMITDFREDLEDPDLPFIVGQLGNWREISEPFNEMLTHVPDSILNTAWVCTEGLSHNQDDSLHFDSASLNILGRRYAERVIELVYRRK
ncbi:MAG: sialate O-acetylesterase [Bacteroidia bacterium]|nr:MAG: sialate O-acetylesterase [Bacteroidia bacterium]